MEIYCSFTQNTPHADRGMFSFGGEATELAVVSIAKIYVSLVILLNKQACNSLTTSRNKRQKTPEDQKKKYKKNTLEDKMSTNIT